MVYRQRAEMTHQALFVDLNPARRGFKDILLDPVLRGHERAVSTVRVERNDLMNAIDENLAEQASQRRVPRAPILQRQLPPRADAQSNLRMGLLKSDRESE